MIFVATTVAAHQQELSDDVVVKTRAGHIVSEEKTIQELLEMCDKYSKSSAENKVKYVGGTKYPDGEMSAKNKSKKRNASESCERLKYKQPPISGTCYFAEVNTTVTKCEDEFKDSTKHSTPLRNCANYLLKNCIGEQNIAKSTRLPFKLLTGSVYIIV